jgi:DNA polymerase elongation subunit (family B)
MAKLIFDIETVGDDFNSFDETTQDALTHWIEREASGDEKEYARLLENTKNGLGFSPLTGRIVAIGVLDYERNKGAVHFDAPSANIKEFVEGNFTFKSMNEKEMLENFWRGAENYQEFITFNGRGFDVPFMMARSAICGVRPTKDLLSNRYLNLQKFDAKHVDLQDQLSFYGAFQKKGSLHMWSRAFGIKSPKAEGVTGDDVKRLFEEKKFREIAKYNSGDVIATRDLYDKWLEFLRF